MNINYTVKTSISYVIMKVLIFLILIFFIHTKLQSQSICTTCSPDDFVTTWDTEVGFPNCTSCITIPTSGSGYDYEVDWNNDGIFEEVGITGNITHDYGTSGIYTIRIRGDFPRIYFNNEGDHRKLLEVNQWGDNVWQTMEGAFEGCRFLVITDTFPPDLSEVTNMNNMFAKATFFNSDIGNWVTGNITDMKYVFAETEEFNQDISNWDVSNVVSMVGMFSEAEKFNKDIGSWNTINVTNMNRMFSYTQDFNQDISNWDVSNVLSMELMFIETKKFNKNIGAWDTANVTDMSQMFYGTNKFNQDIGSWDTGNVIDMSQMFYRSKDFNQNIGGWNTSNVTNMYSMFSQAEVFNQDIGDWSTGNVSTMYNMFFQAEVFNQDIKSWDTGNVTNMEGMFYEATSFNQDIGIWNIGAASLEYIFSYSGLSVTNYDAILTKWSDEGYSSKTLHASDIAYCFATEARLDLIENKGWTINDDTQDCSNVPCETPDGPFASNILADRAVISAEMLGLANRYYYRYRVNGVTGSSTFTLKVRQNGNPFTLRSLIPGTEYEMNVRVRCEDGSFTDWSEDLIFTTSACFYPDPIDLTLLLDDRFRLEWTAVPLAEKYQIWYRPLASTNPYDKIVTVNPFRTIQGLTPNTTYEYKVRTLCEYGWSYLSPQALVTTMGAGSIGEGQSNEFLKKIQLGDNILLYPNPVSNLLFVEMPQQILPAFAKILDVNGHHILTVKEGGFEKGINISKLPQGTYSFILVNLDGNIYTKRFVKI